MLSYTFTIVVSLYIFIVDSVQSTVDSAKASTQSTVGDSKTYMDSAKGKIIST